MCNEDVLLVSGFCCFAKVNGGVTLEFGIVEESLAAVIADEELLSMDVHVLAQRTDGWKDFATA